MPGDPGKSVTLTTPSSKTQRWNFWHFLVTRCSLSLAAKQEMSQEVKHTLSWGIALLGLEKKPPQRCLLFLSKEDASAQHSLRWHGCEQSAKGGDRWKKLVTSDILFIQTLLACTDSSESISQSSGMHAQSGGLSTSCVPEGGYMRYSFSRKERRESYLPLWGARILLGDTGVSARRDSAVFFKLSSSVHPKEADSISELLHHDISGPALPHAGHTEPCTMA